MQKILIIGAGEIGQALGRILKKENKIKYWDKYNKYQKENLKNLVLWSKIIFISTPAAAVFEILKKIKNFNLKTKILICVSKGIDLKTNQRMDQILNNFTSNFGLLYGPMIAEELNQNKFGFGILVSKNKKVLKIKKIFNNTKIKIKLSDDLVGVSLCGILKNIYALGLGLIDGLNLGLNFKGYYISQAITEIYEIVKELGGKKESVLDLCGAGDLIATGLSQNSANYLSGFLKAKNKKIIKLSEGLKSLSGIKKILKAKKIKTSIFDKIYRIFYLNKDIKEIFKI